VAVCARASHDEIDALLQTGAEASASQARIYTDVVAPWLESDAAGVERGARERCLEVERLGLAFYHANTLGNWATALCDTGDRQAALEAIGKARQVAAADDVADQIVIDAAEAYARALGGERRAALELLERAHRQADGIDMVLVTEELDHVEAMVRGHLGDLAQAREVLTALVERAEARGIHRYADRYRRDLAGLD
jgi:hypothetical protein